MGISDNPQERAAQLQVGWTETHQCQSIVIICLAMYPTYNIYKIV